jgi:hypothetical protein
VKFEGGAVAVEHGTVKLATSKNMSARAGMVTAAPTPSAWTEFELTDVNGTVRIVALKGDLQISNGSETMTLSQGQQAMQKDSDATQSKQDRSAAMPSAVKRNAAFILATAGPGSAEAVARDLETASVRGVLVAHPNAPHISPVKP